MFDHTVTGYGRTAAGIVQPRISDTIRFNIENTSLVDRYMFARAADSLCQTRVAVFQFGPFAVTQEVRVIRVVAFTASGIDRTSVDTKIFVDHSACGTHRLAVGVILVEITLCRVSDFIFQIGTS